MNALDLSDLLENLREPGTSRLSASRVAHLFDMQLQELAELAKVHRNTLRVHPESPKLQKALRDLVRLLCALKQQARVTLRHYPEPADLLQMIQDVDRMLRDFLDQHWLAPEARTSLDRPAIGSRT